MWVAFHVRSAIHRWQKAINLVSVIRVYFVGKTTDSLNEAEQYWNLLFFLNRLHYEILEGQPPTTTQLTSSCSFMTQFRSSPNGSSSPADSNKMVQTGFYSPSVHVISGLSQPPRQKGRPRKRKPKDIDALTANLGKRWFLCKDFKESIYEKFNDSHIICGFVVHKANIHAHIIKSWKISIKTRRANTQSPAIPGTIYIICIN